MRYCWLLLLLVGCQQYIDDVDKSESFPVPEVEATAAGVPGWQMPKRLLTPGAYWKAVKLDDVKQPGYSARVRNVPQSLKIQVALRYGMAAKDLDSVEIDHLVPLSWGGSNDIENLWPEKYTGEWGARVKDRLEVKGLKMIRDGDLDLRDAQRRIAANWVQMYRDLIGEEPVQIKSLPSEQ